MQRYLNLAYVFKDIVGFDFDKNTPHLFKNTMDKYTGEWSSNFVCSSLFMNDNDPNPEILKLYRKISCIVKEYNYDSKHQYKIVGVELNRFTDCKVEPHIDDANFDNRRIRVLISLRGSFNYTLKIDGKEYSSFNDLEIDCTKEHSFENKGTMYFLVVDLLPFTATPKDSLSYLLNPMLYYMNKYNYSSIIEPDKCRNIIRRNNSRDDDD